MSRGYASTSVSLYSCIYFYQKESNTHQGQMSFDFFGKGVEIIKQGIKEDEARNYSQALKLYINGIEHWMTGLKYSKSDRIKDVYRLKIREFLSRSELLKGEVEKQKVKTKVPTASHAKVAATASDTNDSEAVDAETKRLRESLEGSILKEKPTITYNDVAGLENAKRALHESVLLPTKFPHMFKNGRKPWKGILMYGPPGTGKTYLAKATANAANATFFSVSSSDLVSKWVGESEKLVKELFTMAINSKPAIIFIDEIDAIASKRTDGETDATRRLKNEFLIQMTRIADQEGVLVLAATNRPFDLDAAVRRRFENYIPLPDAPARLELLKMQVEGEDTNLDPQGLKRLATQTERFSGADIAILARDALMAPVRDAVKSSHWKRVPRGAAYAVTPCPSTENGAFPASLMDLPPDAIQLPDLKMEHFDRALKNTRPSVSDADIKEHEEFTRMYGENGAMIDNEINEKEEEPKEAAPGTKVAVQEKKRKAVGRSGSKANPVLVV